MTTSFRLRRRHRLTISLAALLAGIIGTPTGATASAAATGKVASTGKATVAASTEVTGKSSVTRRAVMAGKAAVTEKPEAAGRSEAAGKLAKLRVNQGGYLVKQRGQAFLMTSSPTTRARFQVRSGKHLIAAGRVGADRGAWNATYKHTYPLALPALRRAGRYRIVVLTSPKVAVNIRVRTSAALFGELLSDGVAFDQVQRDGGNVATAAGQALHRKPSHLHDASADVYEWPTFDPDSDEIISGPPVKTGATADVSGGWFDAGDYLKFTHTAAFADLVLLAAQRDLGRKGPASLAVEGRYGTDWLDKMWDQNTRTLHLQVGTGNGTADGELLGDHDLWRLPEADDGDSDPADVLAAAHRPVFDAAPAGQPISPNLAGRVAAAFALAAQNDAVRHPARARLEYRAAASVIALADTASPPEPLTTVLPNDFYPETSWHDDMELADAELALAAQRLHLPSRRWLSAGAHWAEQYLAAEAEDAPDTFNLYDTSALAHVDLVRAMRAATHPSAAAHSSAAAHPSAAAHSRDGLAVTRTQLIGDLTRQLKSARTASAKDPFGAAANVADFDVDSHTFGIVATAGWFHSLTGSSAFDALASTQRGWVLGANAWGRSFMVGVGQDFPHCMQHQVANLSGSTTGRPPLLVGAVVNGPNGAENFEDGLGDFQDGMTHCSVKGLATYDGHGSRYVDDVRSWQTDEPALDMTATAIAAAAAQWRSVGSHHG